MSDYPKHLYRSPGPYGQGKRTYAIAGAAGEEQEKALLARGWFASRDEAFQAAAGTDTVPEEPEKAKGGNTDRMNALRAEYRKLAGKAGGPRWDEATYEKKIAALKEAP